MQYLDAECPKLIHKLMLVMDFIDEEYDSLYSMFSNKSDDYLSNAHDYLQGKKELIDEYTNTLNMICVYSSDCCTYNSYVQEFMSDYLQHLTSQINNFLSLNKYLNKETVIKKFNELFNDETWYNPVIEIN